MTLLDVVVAVMTACVVLYSVYGYFKERAELPKYRPQRANRDGHSTEVAKMRA